MRISFRTVALTAKQQPAPGPAIGKSVVPLPILTTVLSRWPISTRDASVLLIKSATATTITTQRAAETSIAVPVQWLNFMQYPEPGRFNRRRNSSTSLIYLTFSDLVNAVVIPEACFRRVVVDSHLLRLFMQ
jgi:hypothetical protein